MNPNLGAGNDVRKDCAYHEKPSEQVDCSSGG